jgi:hypothetical protein
MTDDLLPEVVAILRQTLRMEEPDLSVPLHRKLYETIVELGRGATLGQRVVALRYVFNWELIGAGQEYADAKIAYERTMNRAQTRWLAEPKMSVAKAEILAEGEDGVFELKLKYLLAEKREQSMRKFLDTLDAALENHRTDRADLRAGDRAHAQGLTGGV